MHQLIHSHFSKFLIFLLVPWLIVSQSQVANFPQIPLIKTGDHKAISVRLPAGNSTTRPQDYFRTFGSNPIVAIGIMIFDVEAGNTLGFTVSVGSISRSGFISTITALTDTYINQLFYTYVAVDSSQMFGIFVGKTFTGLPVTNTQASNTMAVGRTLNPTHKYTIQTFLKDFTLVRSNNDLSLRLSSTVSTSTSEFTTTLLTNSTVSSITYYIFYLDKTVLEQTQQYFIDAGTAYTEYRVNNNMQFSVEPSIFNYFNFMRGLNWLSFNASSGNSLFSIKIDSFPFATVSSYKYAMSNLLHWRKRECPNITYYYLQQEIKCYETCPSGYANNNVDKFCQKCDYKCKECLADGSTCTTCDNYTLTHRGPLTNGSCLCEIGYFDVGNNNDTCEVCNYTCTTCLGAASTCTSCHTTRDYDNITNTCTCKPKKYDPLSSTPQCLPCHYSCQTCSSSTSNSCLSCSPSSNRILTQNSCFCRSTFSQPSPAGQTCIADPALVCSQNCLTCSTVSSNCTGCGARSTSKRELVNNFCRCISGYTSNNNVQNCREVCGDGLRFDLACDDGNTNSGDGCSSSCGVEAGYQCDTAVSPNICIYTTGYTITRVSMNKRQDSNILDIVFSIQPSPPPSSTPTLSLPSLTILSSTFSLASPSTSPPTSLLSLVVSFNQSIPQGTLTSLSLSSIGTSQQFPVSSDNNLSLTLYPTDSYTAYRVFQGLVFFYLGLWWLGVIVFGVLINWISKQQLLALGEFMTAVGAVAVGVTGFQKVGVFYKAVDYVKYVYGYNIQVKGQDGLFAYANYGLLFLLLPYIIFSVYSLIKKVAPSTFIPNLQTRKYLIFEVPLLYYMFYSILIVASLLSQLKSNTPSTALSITSIIFGILYLLGFIVLCILYVRRYDKFSSISGKMLLSKGPIYFVVSILCILIGVGIYFGVSYGVASSVKKYAGLGMTGLCILLITLMLILRPYQNNIRILINSLTIGISYFCYYLVSELKASEWTAFVILTILYLHMIYNYADLSINLYRASKRKEIEETQESEDSSEQRNYGHQGQGQGADGYFDNSGLRAGELQEPNKVDLDFDPHKEIAQSRMETVKRQNKYETIHSPFSQQNYGSPTVRKQMLAAENQQI